jgi:hypothetical protein
LIWTQRQVGRPERKRAKGRCKLVDGAGMPGAGLTVMSAGQARPDSLALKPYWGKPAVRNLREGDGNVGIIRSPVRAIALPDLLPAPLPTPCPRSAAPEDHAGLKRSLGPPHFRAQRAAHRAAHSRLTLGLSGETRSCFVFPCAPATLLRLMRTLAGGVTRLLGIAARVDQTSADHTCYASTASAC